MPLEEHGSFGIAGWLEETRVALPLKGVECRFDVCGDILNVETDQIYHQSAAKPLDCTYTFPLPAGAAVYCCELHVNGRTIRARVEEAQEARRVYVEKKSQGRRAALVEMERENLFTLSLGNLQPGDVVVVRFAYFQILERLDDQLSVQIPVCPGVRYIPGKPLLRDLSGIGTEDDTDQVPDASSISPPRIDALHPDAAYFYLKGRIDAKMAIAETISSPTHPVVVTAQRDANSIGVLIADGGAVPDRDFVLRWQQPEETALTPLAWQFSDGERYALVQLRAPVLAKADDTYQQDVYFLIDRSGSMQGIKWTKTCEALQSFMDILGKGDRAWITFFESSHRNFAEKPLPAREIARQRAFQTIERIGTAGGTELLPALNHVIEAIDNHSSRRHAVLLIITDGQIGNEEEVLEALRHHPGLTVHVFGIDMTVNDALLKSIARQQRGQCFLMTPEDDIRGVIAKLGDRIRRPVLTGIEVEGEWRPASETIPDLFSGQVADIPLKATAIGAPVRIKGTLPNGEERLFSFNPASTTNPAVKLLWAKARIDSLLATRQNKEAISLSKQNNLLCAGTCFVAWDAAEQVPIAQEGIYQPSLLLREAGALFCQSPRYYSLGAAAPPSARLADESFGDFIEEAAPAPDLDEITNQYAGWPESISIMLAETIESAVAEIGALLPFSEKLVKAILAFLGHWTARGKDSVEARVELLYRLRDDLKQAGGIWQQLCETLTQFIEKHCAADAELRDPCHILAKVCSDALTQPPGD
jgi:Ca-activated chloride channel family protein